MLRCLIVDDSPRFLDAARGLLELEGVEVLGVASTGTEAIRRIQELRPDVILLDIEMGAQNGLDAVRPIKSLAASTRVLMLTTFFDGHSRFRALRDGASDFLLKRDPVVEIVRRIRQALSAPEKSAEFAEFESAGTSGRSSSSWPNRRALEWENGRIRNGNATQTNPDGRRNALWRYVSSRLMRGVGYLRGLLGPKEYHEHLSDPQSQAASGH